MQMIPSDSSMIEAHGYDPKSQTLRLKFRNGSRETHDYSGIGPELYATFRSGSHGQFFHQHLKKNEKHPSRKVEI